MGVGDRRRPAGRGGGDRCSGLGAPSWGGKGDRRGGGRGETQEAPAPPPARPPRRKPWRTGEAEPPCQLEACGGGDLGPRERPSRSGATGVSVPHCGGGGGTRTEMAEGKEGRGGRPSLCRSCDAG